MQPLTVDARGTLTAHLAPRRRLAPLFLSSATASTSRVSISCAAAGGGGGKAARPRRKENVWSVDNDRAAAGGARRPPRERFRRRRGRAPPPARRTAQDANSRVLVSGSMLMEIETVLQTQEPVIKPAWDTFSSSLSGIWKGVGAVFSPFTAEMEPIGVGPKQEYLYDCYTLSHIERSAVDSHGSEIRRKTNWMVLNPFGETRKQNAGDGGNHNASHWNRTMELPTYESFDMKKSELMEEDVMVLEPGLVFFEDGSYSRGPVGIQVEEYDESNYFLSPTYKFEQCLVKGCHKRLRIVHTIEFNEGGASIQIVRVAVYEEQWVNPANIHVEDNTQVDLKCFSQRKRTQPSELSGSWKVFEVSATPIFTDNNQETEIEGGLPFIYLCTETLKKRTLPESSIFFGEEETLDMNDVTILWLPGGVTAYVDVDKDGILCIGVGWYSEEGINLVMERDYGTDGKLREVRWKSEVKRRWNQPVPV